MTSSLNHTKTFQWKGINTLGKKVKGEMKALNKAEALSQLKKQFMFSIKIHRKNALISCFTFKKIPQKNALLSCFTSKKILQKNALLSCFTSKKIPQKNALLSCFTSKKIPHLMIVFFFRQLATLLSASVPIVQSLTILHKMNNHLIFQKMIITIKQDLESGKLLSFSLQKFLRYFDNITCQLIHVGEQSGTLATILQRIATQKEHHFHLKKQVIQSLIYPTIILSLALVVSIIMLTFVVPRFAELFKTMHGTLPTLTLAVIALSHFMQKYSWILFLLSGGAFLCFKYVSQLPPVIKKKIDHFVLTLPFIGVILSKMILARFARYLAIALNAGIPLAQSLKMLENIFGNLHYEEIISTLRTDIAKGQQLHQSMRKYPYFPMMMIQMIKIGEESGTIEKMLEKIAEIYEFDTNHLISNMSHTLEPLIMIILGVLIGGLVIAMYLPIFKLGTLM